MLSDYFCLNCCHMAEHATLARRLGLFDATMLVMGGIVGAGIFMNPYVVAQQVHTPLLIIGAWIVGGVIALAGAFLYAELAQRLPATGGQYAYIRKAYHPLLAFLYGWTLLLVTQTGGMAAVAVTFSRYLIELTGWHAADWLPATVALSLLTLLNCLGVRSGGTVQSALMVLKIGAVLTLITGGIVAVAHPSAISAPMPPLNLHLLSSFGAAMVPVLFAYGGWQTANFVAAEMRDPRRDLPRALILGVIAVIFLYTAVNYVCLRALGPFELAATRAPASAVMRIGLGNVGARIIALGIAISALGFLAQGILTAPRVYFAMAEDGVFFRALARVNARTRVPILAIVLQSIWTIIIVLTGRYEQILNYVVSMDWIFFGITASTLFVFRKHEIGAASSRMPGHPWSTALFCSICAFIVANTIYRYPQNTLIGMAILATGIPVYFASRARPSALDR